MSEDLAEYFSEIGVKCRYLHSEVETLDRIKILRDLRRGEFDVLIGINLLREGLDLPEVSLVAILDADKEGFLRSTTSLIQTIGRCARHVEGRAILYADRLTGSMDAAIDETNRRRNKQLAYNTENNITPMSIIKGVDMELAKIVEADYVMIPLAEDDLDRATAGIKNEEQMAAMLAQLEIQMREAAKKFEFEKAATLRDKIRSLKQTRSRRSVRLRTGDPRGVRVADTPLSPASSKLKPRLASTPLVYKTSPATQSRPAATSPPSTAATCTPSISAPRGNVSAYSGETRITTSTPA